MNQSQPRPRKRGRKILLGLGTLMLLLVVFIALLPTLISWGLGQGYIKGKVAEQVNGTVDWQSLSVGWFSGVNLDQLAIQSDDQKTRIDLSLKVGSGLLGLAFGNLDLGEVNVSGAVKGVRRTDGTTSIGDLFKTSEEPKEESTGPGQVPSSLAALLKIGDFDVAITDEASGETLGIENFKGSVEFAVARPIVIDLNGATKAGATAGSIALKGDISDLFASDGAITASNAKASLEGTVEQVSLAMIDALLGMNNRLASITGDMLKSANLAIDGGMSNGSVLINVQADRVMVGGVVKLADSVATISTEAPLVVRLTPSDAMLAAYLRDTDPASIGFTARPQMFASGSAPGVVSFTVNQLALKMPGDAGLDLAGGSVEASLSASGFGVELPRTDATERLAVEQFTFNVSSADLTKVIDGSLALTTLLNGSPTGNVSGSFRANELIRANGEVIVDPDRIVASLEANDVPTTLAQLFVTDLPINLPEDVGPTVNVMVSANATEPGSLALRATAANLDADLRAVHDAETGITGQPSTVKFTLNDKLITAFAQDRVRVPRTFTLAIDQLRVPAKDGEEGLATDRATVSGRLTLNGEPVGPMREGTPLVRTFDIGYTADAAGPSIGLDGQTAIDNATITLAQHVRMITADEASPVPPLARLRPEGTITIELPNTEVLAPFLADHLAKINAALGGALTTTITTKPESNGFTAAIAARSPGVTADVAMRTTPESIAVEPSTITSKLTTALAEALLPPNLDENGQRVDGPSLTKQGALALRNLKATIPFGEDGSLKTDAITAGGSLAIEGSPTLRLKQEAAGMTIAELTANFTAALGEALDVSANGSTRLTADGAGELTKATFTASAKRASAESELQPTLSLNAPLLAIAALERALGLEAGLLSGWTGEQGSVTASVTPASETITAQVAMNFPRIGGTFDAALNDTLMTVTAKDPRLTLAKSTLQKILNPPPAEGAAAPPMLLVDADVPLTITWNQFRVPRAALTGEPADPALMNVDLKIAAGAPLVLIELAFNNARRELRDLTFNVTSNNLATVRFGLTGRATASNADPGNIDITGALRRLVAEDKTFSTENAVIDLTVAANSIPTAVIDAVQRWDGLVAAALGPTVNADIKAIGFSTRTGSVEAKLNSATSSLQTRLLGRREALVMEQDASSNGSFELSPAFRQKLLEKIHPLLADIRQTEQPIKLTASNTLLPLDSDLLRLRADLELTIGKMAIDKGSALLQALTLINQTGNSVIDGSIEPIRAKIRNGVVTYDRFAVKIGSLTLAYNGRVDLVNKTVDIYTELPMDAMALGIKGLGSKVGTIPVRLRTHGSFNALKTEPAPLDEVRSQQLLQALAQLGAEKALPEARKDGRVAAIAQIAALAVGGASNLLKEDSNNQVGSLLNMKQDAIDKELSRQIQALMLKELGLSDPGNILENILRDRGGSGGGRSGSGGG